MAISQVRYDSSRVRVLCAHRSGPFGVDGWNVRAERLLERAEVQARGHYPGQPIMVTANDPTRRLFNGDVGVVVRDDRGLWVAFPNFRSSTDRSSFIVRTHNSSCHDDS